MKCNYSHQRILNTLKFQKKPLRLYNITLFLYYSWGMCSIWKYLSLVCGCSAGKTSFYCCFLMKWCTTTTRPEVKRANKLLLSKIQAYMSPNLEHWNLYLSKIVGPFTLRYCEDSYSSSTFLPLFFFLAGQLEVTLQKFDLSLH